MIARRETRFKMMKRKIHSPEFKAKIPFKAIRGENTLAEPSKQYCAHATQISTWNRAVTASKPVEAEKSGLNTHELHMYLSALRGSCSKLLI